MSHGLRPCPGIALKISLILCSRVIDEFLLAKAWVRRASDVHLDQTAANTCDKAPCSSASVARWWCR